MFDKFQILKHPSDDFDEVRRRERDRTFIKGQRYTLLSHQANLDEEGRLSLRLLLKANKWLHKAYLLKEAFGLLWDYNNPSKTSGPFPARTLPDSNSSSAASL